MMSFRRTYLSRNRIPPVAHPQSERNIPVAQQAVAQANPLSQIAELLRNLIGQAIPSLNLQQSARKSGRRSQTVELQARDEEILIELPPIKSQQMQQQHLQQWITQVAQVVCSSAFRGYFKGEMTFEQTKIYCSENIIKNIVYLSQHHKITPEQFGLLEETLQKKALSYVSQKYPLKENVSVSRKLDKLVQEIDKSELIDNNEIANNKIDFQLRESGNYNDLIMKMINTLILKTNPGESEDHFQTNLYAHFEEYVTRIFEKAEDEDWVSGMLTQPSSLDATELKLDSPRKSQREDSPRKDHYRNEDKAGFEKRQRYRASVKEYSQAHFGRKIPEMIAPFSAKQIASGQLSIKHPSILRILTKWCEQLWKQFQTPNYYENRSLSLLIQNVCEVRTLYPWLREDLNSQLQREKENITKYMKNLSKQNRLMQVELLEREKHLNKKGRYLDQLDQISGKLSINMSHNLHHQIVAELNRLIHGLMIVSDQFFRKHLNRDNLATEWPYPPSLVTFRIGDIIRCKFSSKEKEIVAIYKQLQRISRESPQILSIVRLKNRLKKSTNDILVNVRFHQSILCQIQLAINSKASQFIKCSNSFQHFIYQLERSRFGPLTELSSIRVSYDSRTEIYQQIIDEEKIEAQRHNCQLNNIQFTMKEYYYPFICNGCNSVCYTSSHAISHRKCSKCEFTICSKCFIETLSLEQLANLIKDKQRLSFYDQVITQEQQLSSKGCRYGFYVPLQAKTTQITYFRIVKHNNTPYLIGRSSNQSLYQIANIKTSESQRQFLNSNIVVLLNNSQEFIDIDQQQARKRCIIMGIVKQGYKKQKSAIQLQCLELNTADGQLILSQGTQTQRSAVVQLDLTQNEMEHLPFEPQDFPNLSILNFSRNPIKTLKDLTPLTKLTTIALEKCGLTQIPSFLFNMATLQSLSFYKNPIHIIPDDIERLVNLKSLSFQNADIDYISPKIGACLKLESLSIQGNELTEVTETICNLQRLKCLNLFNNKIKKLPDDIGKLQNLAQLRLHNNFELQQLPSSITKLKKLKYINISQTKISNVDYLTQTTVLQNVIIRNTKVECLPEAFAMFTHLINVDFKGVRPNALTDHLNARKTLKKLVISGCSSLILPEAPPKCNVEKISLTGNNLAACTDFFSLLSYLKQLNLRNNCLREFPNLAECQSLSQINISQNRIKNIPDIKHLSKLKLLDVSHNQITLIDDSLLALPKIQKIDASHNQIGSITNTLADDEGIKWTILQLILGNNYLKDMPSPLLKCKRLRKLDLSFNPLTALTGIQTLQKSAQLLINDKSVALINNRAQKAYNKTNQIYLQVPNIIDPRCNICKELLRFPFYWLRWEEEQDGPKFGCQACIEAPSTLINHHYNYEENSILLHSDRRALLSRELLGQNIQPKLLEQAKALSSSCCVHCIKGRFELGTARYICLQCQQDESLIDLCHKCWQKYNLNDDWHDVGNDLPANHHKDHSWLRVLYGDHYWTY